ncbi:MAG TPA: hypothetical protein VFK02_33270 [Kofleriaceae bacterium]|nr:hypothetical protein [Kofleriaceae bacterium]
MPGEGYPLDNAVPAAGPRLDALASFAYGVARLTDVPIDDLLKGALLSRTCPHCGRPPDDFLDEETVVEDRPRGVARTFVE